MADPIFSNLLNPSATFFFQGQWYLDLNSPTLDHLSIVLQTLPPLLSPPIFSMRQVVNDPNPQTLDHLSIFLPTLLPQLARQTSKCPCPYFLPGSVVLGFELSNSGLPINCSTNFATIVWSPYFLDAPGG
jgi:hypothetical protein